MRDALARARRFRSRAQEFQRLADTCGSPAPKIGTALLLRFRVEACFACDMTVTSFGL
jgi:hypothetical protein